MPTTTRRLSEAARSLGAPLTAGSIDPTDATAIPTPPTRDRAAGARDAFTGRTTSPLAATVIGVAEDLDALAPIVALLRDGLAGTQGDQEDLAGKVHEVLSKYKKRLGEQQLVIEGLQRRIELLEATRVPARVDAAAALGVDASTVQS